MKCSKCGNEIKTEEQFCSKCGNRINGKKKLPTWVTILGTTILGIIIAIILIQVGSAIADRDAKNYGEYYAGGYR